MSKKKTILVVYTPEELKTKKAIGGKKRYSFNTEADVEEGDMLHSTEYSTNMQVVKVLDEEFQYYNSSTGELSNVFKSTAQWEIRDLIIRDKEEADIVYATLLTKDK